MDAEPESTGYSQRSAYNRLSEKLYEALVDALQSGSRALLSTYLQSLLAFPDGCTRGETVLHPEKGEIIADVPPLLPDRIYPKERALVDLVAA